MKVTYNVLVIRLNNFESIECMQDEYYYLYCKIAIDPSIHVKGM